MLYLKSNFVVCPRDAYGNLRDDDDETYQVDQESAQSTGCSKGCMEKVSTTFYVVGGLIMLGGCTADEGGGVMFFGLILIGIGYATQKSTPKG